MRNFVHVLLDTGIRQYDGVGYDGCGYDGVGDWMPAFASMTELCAGMMDL